jgi:hypothetical protein
MRRLAIGGGSALLGLLMAGCLATAQTPAATLEAPPKPPLAYSGYASQTSTTTATITAAVNPRGLETSYYLQYGPSPAYGAQTPTATVAAGTSEVKLAESLAGLQANTTYHFRLVATNAAGTGSGPDRTFLTKKIPLTLSATVNPNPEEFGMSLTVAGSLAGSDAANQALVLQIDPYPYKQGFKDLGNPELSDAAGSFSFAVGSIAASAQLRVAALGPPIVYGPILTEHVSIRASFHARSTKRRGFYRLYGTVAPALAGAHLAFQRLGRHGKPVTVSGTVLKRGSGGSSHFARTVRLRRKGRYRVVVQSPTPALLSNHSRWVRVR